MDIHFSLRILLVGVALIPFLAVELRRRRLETDERILANDAAEEIGRKLWSGDTILPPFEFLLRTTKSFVVASFIAVVALPLAARAGDPAPICDAPMQMIRFSKPLTHISQKLNTTEPITIVAIGSSSTAGAGASSPAATYPSRLQVELNRHFPGHSITVLNRGVGGEEIGDMLKRFDLAVVAVKPDLVLWQFGTNAVIQDQKLGDDAASIRSGLAKIRSVGADIVLIDPQFAPKVIAKPEALQMVELIGHQRQTRKRRPCFRGSR